MDEPFGHFWMVLTDMLSAVISSGAYSRELKQRTTTFDFFSLVCANFGVFNCFVLELCMTCDKNYISKHEEKYGLSDCPSTKSKLGKN